MNTTEIPDRIRKGIGFKLLMVSSSILLLLLLIGQTLALIDYEWAVSMDLQESVAEVTEVGVAFAKGFALADTVIYIPLLLLGIIGLMKKKNWGSYCMFGSLAISVYWPIVHLLAIFVETNSIELLPEKYVTFTIVLSLVIIYGIWGMWYLYENRRELVDH